MTIKSVVTLDSDNSICCRYCGHLFHNSDLPVIHHYVYDEETRSYRDMLESYIYERCPRCLHVLDFSVDIDLPLNTCLVWRMQFRLNPDSGRIEFRNEKRYLRKE